MPDVALIRWNGIKDAEAMRIILGIIFLVFVVMCAVAGGHIDDPNHDWFEHQRNSAGKTCCEIADGHRVDDADWKSDGAGDAS